jgi:hypothetical protein
MKERILGHICPGGKFPGTIRKYPSLFCSLCTLVQSGQFEIRVTEESINKYNKENKALRTKELRGGDYHRSLREV